MKIIRQGDVLLIASSEAPSGEPVEDPRGVVLAEGETSGHHHQFFGDGARLFQRSTNERLLVVGGRGGALRVVGGGVGGVDRHTPISLAPGNYLVRIQRAWTSALASRQVAD